MQTVIFRCKLNDLNSLSQMQLCDTCACAVPRTQTRLGDRSFTAAGPRLWNNLPVELRQRDRCLSEFRRLLKTFLFWRDSAPCDFLFKCAVYTYLLTYLLPHVYCSLSNFELLQYQGTATDKKLTVLKPGVPC